MEQDSFKNATFDNLPRMLASLYSEVIGIKGEIAKIRENFQPKEPPDLMTRKEVAKLLKCDESTVHNWTVKKKLVKYCLGNRTFYKRSEVLAALVAIK